MTSFLAEIVRRGKYKENSDCKLSFFKLIVSICESFKMHVYDKFKGLFEMELSVKRCKIFVVVLFQVK